MSVLGSIPLKYIVNRIPPPPIAAAMSGSTLVNEELSESVLRTEVFQ